MSYVRAVSRCLVIQIGAGEPVRGLHLLQLPMVTPRAIVGQTQFTAVKMPYPRRLPLVEGQRRRVLSLRQHGHTKCAAGRIIGVVVLCPPGGTHCQQSALRIVLPLHTATGGVQIGDAT